MILIYSMTQQGNGKLNAEAKNKHRC